MHRPARHRVSGFTLIELVIVIVLSGIVATFAVGFITKPVEGYVDLARRAELTDSAESALRLMARDIRAALPNSLRCDTNGCIDAAAIEMYNTVDGGRYRASSSDPDAELTFPNAGDDKFNVVGTLATGSGAGIRIAIGSNGVGSGVHDPYDAGSRVLTPVGADPTLGAAGSGLGGAGGEQLITLAAPHRFPPGGSPRQRFFLVDGPIGYRCDLIAGQLVRYTGYTVVTGTTTFAPPPADGATAIVAGNVSACDFDYQAGSNTRAGLLIMRITLSSGGESVTLMHQVRVDNAS